MSPEGQSYVLTQLGCVEEHVPSILKSIKEVVQQRTSRDQHHEAVRSTIISACCGEHVNLKKISQLLGIYENRNAHKLTKYKDRREGYMTGRSNHMSGQRYSSDHYGFTEDVMQFMRDWFEDDECSTPDKWGRKVFHTDRTGTKSYKVVRHMKAGDREENHELFVKIRGEQCLQLCTKSLIDAGRKMSPRVPSVTVLEACRPNFAKYFKKSEFGECSTCKPAYDNYKVFKMSVYELNPDIKLPDTMSQNVRSRICRSTIGDKRHECEDNRCTNCSFINYFVKDDSISKVLKVFNCKRTFTEEYDIDFI